MATANSSVLSAFEYSLEGSADGPTSLAAMAAKKKRSKGKGTKVMVEDASKDDGDDDATYAEVSRKVPAAAPALDTATATASATSSTPGPLTLAGYKAAIAPIIKEFLLEEDYDECRQCLEELDAPSFGFEFVRRLVMLCMERGDRERELASRLLSFLYGTDISMEQIGKGFERLFESLDDLMLDIPEARSYTAKFLARAVADEVLPPAYLTDEYIASLAGAVVDEAKALLSMKMSSHKLEHVWHVTGVFTVLELKAAIKAALMEFQVSHQQDEVLRCVLELHTPHFMHEVVYRGVVLTLSKWPSVDEVDRMTALFAYLQEQEALTEGQIVKDLTLDTPQAPQACNMMLDKIIAHGAVNARYAAMMTAAAAAGTPRAAASKSGPSAV